MKNRRKKPGVKLTRAQKKKLEELTRQAKADGRHPSSAQKTIPYLSMYKDGLCRVTENYYTMSLLFDDMNYDLEDEAEQLGIFGGWCSFYSYFDCAVHVQMTGINSENDPEAFARALAVLERNEAYRALCAEYVQLLQTQYMRSNNGQTRIKLMTFGIESESVKGARSRLTRIGLDMQGNFKKIGVESVLMDGKERLSLLHALFHMDDHAPFVFEWSWLPETGLSTKDFIAPGSFDFSPSRSFKIGETYCAASYIQIQTSSLSKKLLGELLRLPSSAVFSLHVQPMDQMTAIKLIKQKQVVLDATKISEQQKAFRSGYDIDIIPRDIDAYGDDTKRLLQTLGTNEKLYMATIVVMNMAGSKRQLDQAVAQTRGILQTRSCALIPLDFQQEKGLMACLPLGINPLKIERCMPTSAVAGFIPFSTQELCRLDGKPVYYGVNRVSGCVIMADRTVNRNPNGLIFGTSGSGKSVSGKQEMIYIYLTTDDQIILCDPEGEYRVLTRRLNGQTIMLSADSHDYINPMDIELEENMDDVLRLKSELILSFCEIVMDGKRNIPAEANSVIDRCLPIIYEKYIKDPKPENMPTLGDLYECLKRQPEPQVRRIVTALELYVTGSLNYFNHHTSVQLNNRLVCFDIKKLGNKLKPLAMLILQNFVWNRISANRDKGQTTRYYIDEFHILLKEPQTAAYFIGIWKRCRKWGCVATGITQNVKDLLTSPEIQNIFDNTDFFLMLNQANADREILGEKLGLSREEMRYLTNAEQGCGLMVCGNVVLPFENRIPTDTQLYRMMTTKPGEMEAEEGRENG